MKRLTLVMMTIIAFLYNNYSLSNVGKKNLSPKNASSIFKPSAKPSAKRCLFTITKGDRKKNERDMKQEAIKLLKEKQIEWNYDFTHDMPTPGEYNWKETGDPRREAVTPQGLYTQVLKVFLSNQVNKKLPKRKRN